jgi:DHA1 family bicyclomycin/chloramphenicol resistance-like MFS transporter
VGCVIGGGCATVSFYAFIAAAPFFLGDRFGQSVEMIGVELFVLIGGVSIGNFISGRFASTTELTRVMLTANVMSLVSSIFLFAQLAAGLATAFSVIATMFVFSVGAGLCSPVVVTKAMSIRPSVAGSASGIYGSGQMLIGALCTAAVGIGQNQGLMAAGVLVVASVVAQASFQVVRKSAPEANRADGKR